MRFSFRSIKFSSLYLLLFATGNIQSAFAQIDMLKYFNPELDVANYTYLKVDFKWDMSSSVQMHLNEGLNFLEEDNIPLALANLNKAVKVDSNVWVCHYYRGICNRKLFHFKEAEQDFLTAISLNRTLAEADIELAKTYLIIKNTRKADIHLYNAIKKNPAIGEAYYVNGMLELTLGNTGQAKKHFEKANEVDPKLASSYLMLGLDDAVKADSSFLPAYFWRGIVSVKKNPQACLEDWNRVVQLDPQNSFYVLMRGFLNIELKDFDNAFIDFKNAVKSLQINEDKYAAGSTVLDQKIDMQAAANYLIATGYGLDDEIFTLVKKSFCLLLAGQNKDALQSIEAAEKKQVSAPVLFLKALVLEYNNEKEKAFEYYGLAISRDNDIYDAHRKKCMFYVEKFDWKNVHVELREMFRLQPASPVGLRLRGMVRYAQGLFGGAIGDFNEYLKKDSTDTEIILTRSACFTALKRYDNANKDLYYLQKKDPENWELCNKIANNFLAIGDSTQAIESVKKFIDLLPNSIPGNFWLIELYVSQKNWPNVKFHVKKISPVVYSFMHGLHSKLKYWEGMVLLYGEKKLEQAIANFEESVKLDPENLAAIYESAKAFELAGSKRKALKAYGELKSRNYKDSEQRYNSLVRKQ